MKKRLKKAAALLSVVILAGSMNIPAFAQDLSEDVPGTEVSSNAEINIAISGITTTLDCESATAAMEQTASGEDISSSNWFLRMNLTDYAASFYYTLEDGTNGDGVQDFNTITDVLNFSYSDGTSDTFNGIKIVDITGASQMTDAEWTSIRENLCNAYSAFLLDHPNILWLTKTPMITRVSYTWTDENGAVSCQNKVYLQLKNDTYRYDIRQETEPEPETTETKSEPAESKSDTSAANGSPAENKDMAASISATNTSYTALKNAVSTVSDDDSTDTGDDTLSGISDTAALYLPTSSASQNTNWFLSDIFETVKDKVYYGDTWGDYVDLASVKNSIQLAIVTDPDTRIDASDGQFILKNYTNMQKLSSDTLLKTANLNPHSLFWEYDGKEYLVERTDPHMHLQVNPKPITVDVGSLQITQAADGSKNPSGEPVFEGLISGDTLNQSDWELIPSDNINSADNTIQVRIVLKEGAGAKYTITNGELWVPYTANLKVEPENVKITLTDRGPFIYNKQEHRPNVEVIVFDHILDKRTYEVSYSKNIDAGVATISVVSTSETDYHWSGTVTADFIISKAAWPQKYGEGTTRYGRKGIFNLYDLNLLAPDGSVDFNKIIFTDERIYAEDGEPSVSNGILQYEIADSETLIGHTSTILIPVDSSNNYESYTITFIVTVSDKTPQDFKFLQEVQKKPLGSRDVLKLTDPAKGSKVTYRSSNEDIVSIDQDGRIDALREGTVLIYAEASAIDEYAEALARCTLTVVPEDHDVTTVELADGDKQYKLEIEEGISQVAEPLRANPDLNLNTAKKIDTRLREEIQTINDEITDENIAVYDITLFTKKNNNWVWEEVPDEDFPGGGLLVKLPYPKDTAGESHDFTVVHMFDSTYTGKLGTIEHPSTDESGEMLRFTVHALSPVAIGWTEQPANDPNTPDDPNGPDAPNGPNTPNGTNGNTATDPGSAAAASGGSGGGSGSGSSGSGGSGGSGGGSALYRVATGDASPIVIYAVLFAASIALITVIYLIRKECKK